MRKPGLSMAEERQAAARRREKSVIEEAERVRSERAEKTARLRELRRAQEASAKRDAKTVAKPTKSVRSAPPSRKAGLPQANRGSF